MSVDFSSILPTGARASSNRETQGSPSLGQDEFMKLLLAQLNNQDPLSPLDNEAFVAQLAQFSTVSGISEISSSVKSLAGMLSANSGATAAQWIGRTISTDSIPAATVTGVSIGDKGALSLTLSDGSTTAVSDVRTIS